MNTLILNKRVMSPRNILNNLVEGDINLVNKAIEFFKQACRPTVGYKQIASYLNIEVIVSSEKKDKSELEKSNEVKMAKYKEELRLMKEAASERKKNNNQAVVIKKPVEEIVKVEPVQEYLDFDSVTTIEPQYEEQDWYQEQTSNVSSKLTYQDFVEELYKGFHLKPTRRLDEIEKVIKAVYRKNKANLEQPNACRELCIQAREAYLALMDNNPTNWTWIPTQTYTAQWFSQAVRMCDPNEE